MSAPTSILTPIPLPKAGAGSSQEKMERYVRQGDDLVCEDCGRASSGRRLLHNEGCPHYGVSILTDREIEVAVLISNGHSPKSIASQLNLSTRTVEAHKFNLMKKLDIHCVAILTRFVIREIEPTLKT